MPDRFRFSPDIAWTVSWFPPLSLATILSGFEINNIGVQARISSACHHVRTSLPVIRRSPSHLSQPTKSASTQPATVQGEMSLLPGSGRGACWRVLEVFVKPAKHLVNQLFVRLQRGMPVWVDVRCFPYRSPLVLETERSKRLIVGAAGGHTGAEQIRMCHQIRGH